MKKTFKILGIVLLVLTVGVVGTCTYFSKSEPEGTVGSEAEALASKIWEALNKKAWDATPFVSWSFAGEHHYVWDKHKNLAHIAWGDHQVLLNPDKVDGLSLEKGSWVKNESLVKEAWNFWCNDMFWLVAPFKVKDPGTTLSLVDKNVLKVQYSSGGVTPGDAYVWYLDSLGMPLKYEMYVSIIPVKGMEATWENWQRTSEGAQIAGSHTIAGKMELSLMPVKTGQNLTALGQKEDLFEPISAL